MLIRDQNWFYIAHSVDELGGSGLRSGYMRNSLQPITESKSRFIYDIYLILDK